MRIKNVNKILLSVIYLVILAVLAVFLYWHLKIGLVRYFDADEFVHLHWGYSLSVGERPYTDFFYLFPPFFLYPVAAIVKVFGRAVAAILAARIFIFLVFLATSGVLFLLAKKLRGSHFALLTVIFFAFLPLPFDKMIEVRPDLLATGLALLGLYLFMKGDEPFAFAQGKGDKGKQGKYFFFSGFSFAASMGFVPKTVFFLVPVGIVFLISHLSNLGHLGETRKKGLLFFLGMLPVGLLFLAMILSFGNLSFALYSMTKMASEVTKVLGVKFYMRPDIFFYPNETYYGLPGWSGPLVINLIIYVSASIWAIHRLLSIGSSKSDSPTPGESLRATPGVSSRPATPGVYLAEFLMVGSFWANLAAFVYFYPLKHAQYLIPVAPFIAFYFVDLWEAVVSKLPKSLKFLRVGATLALLFLISWVGWEMNQRKATWVNKATFEKVNYFLQTIPQKAPVYDLTGESIFFKNGYYFCCLPYGQYEEAFYFRIPDLKKELNRQGTKYVHIGMLTRLNEIPARHARYIKENFRPRAEGGMLWEKLTNAADRQ